jgi:hypothetical protein
MTREQIAAYLVSLPERLVRSLSAVAAGAVHEVGEVVLPARVRRSRLYQSLVESTVRFFVEQVGEVEGAFPAENAIPGDFLVRRAAGNLVEIAGLLAFRASPVWVLAALADIAGAGRDLIGEISAALQKEGLLDPSVKFESVDQLLDGLERTSGRLAETANTPPLDIAGLRKEWADLRSEAAHLPRLAFPAPARIKEQWQELQKEAAAQQRSVVELSSVMALSAVRRLPESARWLSSAARTSFRRTGQILGAGILDHYRDTLAEIRQTGYARYFLRELGPYFKGAARQFSPAKRSATERLLQRTRKR